MFDAHAETDQACCPITEDHCAHDGCELVEGRSITLSSAPKLSLPQLATVCGLICQNAVAVAAETEQLSRPHPQRAVDWTPPWQFAQRAAPSPRAPSRGIA